MATIGAMAVKLTADPGGFVSALDSTAKKAQQWGQVVGQAMTAPLNAFTKAMRLPQNFADGLLKPIGSALSSIPLIGGALSALPMSGAGFTAWLKSNLQEIAQMGMEAKKLGVSVEFLSSMGGIEEGASRGIMHFQRTLGEAVRGSEEARKKFEELGLSWRKLAEGGNENAFRGAIDKLAGIKDVAERNRQAAALFGERVVHDQDFQKMLGRGVGGLDRKVAEGQRQGLGVTTVQAEDAYKAIKAMKDFEKTITGIGRQFAAGLAPYVKAAADAFNEFVHSFGNPKEWVGAIVDGLVEGVASMIDAFGETVMQLKDFLSALKGVYDFVTAKGIGEVRRLDDPRNVKPLLDEEGVPVAAQAATIRGDALRKFRDGLKNRVTAQAAPQGPLLEEIEAIRKMTDEFREQTAVIGMSADQVRLYKMELSGTPKAMLEAAYAAAEVKKQVDGIFSGSSIQATGSTALFLEQTRLLAELRVEGKLTQEAFEKLADTLKNKFKDSLTQAGANAFKETRTAGEQFAAEMAKAQQLRALGKDNGGIDDDTFRRLLGKNFGALEKGVGALPGQLSAPNAIEKGSAADIEAQTRFERQGLSGTNVQERIAAILEQSRLNEEAQTKYLAEIAKGIGHIGQDEVVPAKDLGF